MEQNWLIAIRKKRNCLKRMFQRRSELLNHPTAIWKKEKSNLRFRLLRKLLMCWASIGRDSLRKRRKTARKRMKNRPAERKKKNTLPGAGAPDRAGE